MALLEHEARCDDGGVIDCLKREYIYAGVGNFLQVRGSDFSYYKQSHSFKKRNIFKLSPEKRGNEMEQLRPHFLCLFI